MATREDFEWSGESSHTFFFEKWGFFRLSAFIIAMALLVLLGLEWFADSATPG